MKASITLRNKTLGIALIFMFWLSQLGAQGIFYPTNEGCLLGIASPGDLKLAVSSSAGIEDPLFSPFDIRFERWNFQAGYSPIYRLSFIGSFNKFNSDGNYQLNSLKGSHVEWGAGFYHKIKTSRSRENYILLNIYSGSGWGSTNSIFTIGGESELKYSRFYIHPGVHFLFKYIRLGIGIRYVHLKYNEANIFGKVESYYREQINILKNDNNFNFLELGFQLQAGPKYGKASLTFNPLTPFIPYNLQSDETIISLGIVLELNQFFNTVPVFKKS